MKIGTDMSLKTCWDEGYMTMEFKVRELYPNGRKKGLDRSCQVLFRKTFGDGIPAFEAPEDVYVVNCYRSADDIQEIFEHHREGIIDFAGMPDFEWEITDEYTLLTIADLCDAYCGLE